jgi:hypothetical protein
MQPAGSATHHTIPSSMNTTTPSPPVSSNPHEPVRATVRKALKIITKIEEETIEIASKLVLPDKFNSGNVEHVSQMRMQLDAAVTHVDSAGRSLKLIHCKEREVLDRKVVVTNQLKAIDARISLLGASLPPLPPEKKPVTFDASTLRLILARRFAHYF